MMALIRDHKQFATTIFNIVCVGMICFEGYLDRMPWAVVLNLSSLSHTFNENVTIKP
jgi:hypothetical protein